MLNEHEPLFNVLEQNTLPPPMVTIELNGAKAKIEVDTGVSASIISEETYKTPEEPRLKLETLKWNLHTYTGEKIIVKVVYGDQGKKLPLLVVEGKGPSILG